MELNFEGKNVIIVGPASTLEGKGMGYFIDSHDIVIRLNKAYRIKNFKDYGKKTDYIFCNGVVANALERRKKIDFKVVRNGNLGVGSCVKELIKSSPTTGIIALYYLTMVSLKSLTIVGLTFRNPLNGENVIYAKGYGGETIESIESKIRRRRTGHRSLNELALTRWILQENPKYKIDNFLKKILKTTDFTKLELPFL